MSVGHVKFIPPLNKDLKDLIKGYYIHISDENDFYSSITFYQNVTTTISVYQNSQTESDGRLRKQIYHPNSGYHSILVGQVDKFQEVEFYGPLNRLAIVFHPAGINHFLLKPLSFYLEKHYSHFETQEIGLQSLLPKLFSTKNINTKREMLDSFFAKRLKPFKEIGLLSAVNILVNADPIPKVDELARQVHMSRRTLLRKFRLHLGYSIEEYISTIKFRRALANFLGSQKEVNLTKLALDSQYYDQADFSRQIKERSGLPPKRFFNELDVQENTLFWKH